MRPKDGRFDCQTMRPSNSFGVPCTSINVRVKADRVAQ